MTEADDGLIPASGAGSEFTGDLGLPTPDDTGVQADGSPSEADPAATEDSSAGTPSEETGAPQEAAGYRALGRDWESEDAFGQHYNSLEGRVRAQGQEVAKLNNLVDQWERWHDYQQTQAKANPTPAEANAPKEEKSEPFLDAIDWGAVERIAKEKGVTHALQGVVIGLQDHIQNKIVSGIQDQIAEATQPLVDHREAQRADTEAKGWFLQAANTVDPESGAPLFPDLYEQDAGFDPDRAKAIVNAWGDLVRSHPQFGLTRDGIDYAIALGRQRAATAAKPAAAAAKVAGQVQRDASGKFVKQNEDAATTEAEGATTPADVTGADAQTIDEAEKVRSGIRNAGKASKEASFFGIA